MTRNNGFIAARWAAALVMLCAVSFSSQRAEAGTLEIFFTGLDIELANGELTDSDPAVGSFSELLNATFTVDGFPLGIPIDDIDLDLFVDDVPNIPLVGGVGGVSVPAGGTFDLQFGGGDPGSLQLSLEEVSLTVIDATSVQFAFGASVSENFTQDLPAGLGFEEGFDEDMPITVSFSTQVDGPLSLNGNDEVIGFMAEGTGEIRGGFDPDTNNVIAEPGTVGLAALAGLMGAVAAMRRRLG